MLELRTSLPWRIAYWVVALLQSVVLSAALSAGGILGIVVSGSFFAFFFLLALQSRSPVRVTGDGISDDRLLLRRAWRWEDLGEVVVRPESIVRPDLVLRHERGRVLPLNLSGLTVTRDDVRLDRDTVVRTVVDHAREHRVTVSDRR